MSQGIPRLILATLASLTLASGCSSQSDDAPNSVSAPGNPVKPKAATSEPKSPQAASQERTRENVGIKTGSGGRLYELKFKTDGAKLVDSDEKELARFNVNGTKMKIKLPDDSVAAYVIAKGDEFQVRDESQKVELYELKSQPDGDWKLKDADDHTLAVIKKRDYGYEIEDSNEKSLFKAKVKDGKRSLRNSDDQTVLYTKDEISTLAVTCLGLEQIESLPVRAGLATAVVLLAD